MSTKKLRLCVLSILIICGFVSEVYSQSIHDPEPMIHEGCNISFLKERLARLNKIREESEKNIRESDITMMRVQEIILLARAKGNEKAEKVAEEAYMKAKRAKEEHTKNKEEVEKQMAYLNSIVSIMKQKNYERLSELCEEKKLKYEQVRNHLMNYVKEAEMAVKDFEKIQKEAKEELRTAKIMLLEEIIPLAPEFLDAIEAQEKLYKSLGRLAKIIQSRFVNDQSKSHKLREWVWKLGDIVRRKEGFWYSQYLKNKEKILLIETSIPSLGSAEFAGEIMGKIKSDLEGMLNDCESMEQSTREELNVINILESQEFKDVLSDLLVAGLEQEASELELLAKELEKNGKKLSQFKQGLKKVMPIISKLYGLFNTISSLIKIRLLEDEIDRLYKVTDPERANFWIEEHKKAFEDYKKCRELLQNCYKKE